MADQTEGRLVNIRVLSVKIWSTQKPGSPLKQSFGIALATNAFKVSDAARWITGAGIPVDGGSKL